MRSIALTLLLASTMVVGCHEEVEESEDTPPAVEAPADDTPSAATEVADPVVPPAPAPAAAAPAPAVDPAAAPAATGTATAPAAPAAPAMQ